MGDCCLTFLQRSAVGLGITSCDAELSRGAIHTSDVNKLSLNLQCSYLRPKRCSGILR